VQVGIFYNSISNPGKAPHKVALMDNFRQGVIACSDTAIDYKNQTLPTQPLDAGFVLGYSLAENLRGRTIQWFRKNNIPLMFVDSNILNYAKPEHEWHRYSLNTVYPDTGVYFFKELDTNKWKNYSQCHGVQLQTWRQNGNHILILCQRPHGWNMAGTVQDDWLDQTIGQIRQYSRRPIVVRLHPGDGARQEQIARLNSKYRGSILVSNKSNIKEDLVNCWCAVGFNSTPTAVSAIQGVPVYVEDPLRSWAADIAFTNLSQIENPPCPDRESWTHKIANIHWSNEEVRSGQLWSAVRQYISSAR
jgi:hypothetical protein